MYTHLEQICKLSPFPPFKISQNTSDSLIETHCNSRYNWESAWCVFIMYLSHCELRTNKFITKKMLSCITARCSRRIVLPTNIGITRGTPSVTALLVVSDGVDIWVALRFSYHLYLTCVALVRQGRC